MIENINVVHVVCQCRAYSCLACPYCAFKMRRKGKGRGEWEGNWADRAGRNRRRGTRREQEGDEGSEREKGKGEGNATGRWSKGRREKKEGDGRQGDE